MTTESEKQDIAYKRDMKEIDDNYKDAMDKMDRSYRAAMRDRLMPARPAKPSTRRELRCVR
jgi:hypothetical protein